MTSVRWAAAQTVPVRGDVAANVAEHLRLVALAATEGAAVLVFPELSLTGYELDLGASLAFSQDDTRLTPLVEAARRTAMTLVVGAPIRLGSQLHVGAFVIGPTKAEIYAKQRLGAFPASAAVDGVVPPAEAMFFQPGCRSPLVSVGNQRAAMAICADIGDPDHAKSAAERGAHAYLASMFVIPSEFEGDEARLGGYSRDHAFLAVMSNYGAATGGLRSAGRSSIWSPRGELLVQFETAGSGVVIAHETSGEWKGQALRSPWE